MPTGLPSVTKYCNNLTKTLERDAQKIIQARLNELGDQVVEDIRAYIQKEWYNRYDIEMSQEGHYDRTYSLLKSVRYTIIGKNKIKVYFDRRRFANRIVGKDENHENGVGWQPHRGFDGVRFVDGLIDFIASQEPMGGSKKNPRHGDYVDWNKALKKHVKPEDAFIEYVTERINHYLAIMSADIQYEVYKTLKDKL